jgi:TRAP transporter TAXI family solute receptor
MVRRSAFVRFRETILTAAPVVSGAAFLGLAIWWASTFVEPAPPTQLTIATASKGSPYYRIAERYQQHLARNGIRLELKETAGSLENLRLIRNRESGVQAAIIQGGISNSTEAPSLLSLGRVAYEPTWVFYRGESRLDQLSQLKGKRVLVGPVGGGTNYLATRLLAASGVTSEAATLITMELPEYIDAMASGQADAGILVLGPDARTIQRLLALPGVRLMSLAHADALSQRFPYLSRIDLKQGIVDFARDIPDADTAMVASLAAVVVTEDLHPALANLLTQAIVSDQARPLVGPNGEAPIFQRIAQPTVDSDPEYQMSSEARRVYRSGTPLLQRYLPFWLATLVDRLAVMLLPLVGILLPMLRFAPSLYTWQVRRRLLYWYRELKRVERGIDHRLEPRESDTKKTRLDEIEKAVNEIPLPLGFTNQLYDLRAHIDIVRRRLDQHPGVVTAQPKA